MDKTWIEHERNSKTISDGVISFLDYAFSNISSLFEKIKCPCRKCYNVEFQDRETVQAHMHWNGLDMKYMRGNVPRRVNPKQWAERVKWWASEEAKAKSATNKCNRRKFRMNHRAGSKSLAARRLEFEVETGEKSDKITMFRELYKDKSGQILDKEATAAVVAMEEQLAQHPSKLQSYELREKVFHDVIGRGTRDRVTGLGTGASRARIEGTGQVGSSLRVIELERQVQELQANAEVATSTQASMKATIDTLLASQASL